MDDEYTYNPEDYGSYDMSYDPNSSYSQAGFAPTPSYGSSEVDWNNIPSFDTMPSYQENTGMGDLFGNGTNYGFSPDPNLATSQFMPEQYGQSTIGGMQQTQGMDWANLGKSGMDALSQLFKGGSGGSTSSFLKGLAGLYGAGQDKKYNRSMSNQYPQQVAAVQRFSSPFDVASTGAGMLTPGATTMRDAAQQQLARTNQALQDFDANPEGYNAGLANTNAQIEKVLKAQAALHGNRNNFNAIAPAMLASKAAAQQSFRKGYESDRNAWMNPAGAGISPYSGGLRELTSGAQYSAQGDSPYMDAIGKMLNTNSYESNPQIAELIAAINANKRS